MSEICVFRRLYPLQFRLKFRFSFEALARGSLVSEHMKFDPKIIWFDLVPACDEQTDGQTRRSWLVCACIGGGILFSVPPFVLPSVRPSVRRGRYQTSETRYFDSE